MSPTPVIEAESVIIPAGAVQLAGDLVVPGHAQGLVLFAHGSGSSRHSPRNRFVAEELNRAGLATLLFDLLTEQEESEEQATGRFRFDIGMLAERLSLATKFVIQRPLTRELPVGYFGASTGGAAALIAAVHRSEHVRAVVSRGGRPDLAGNALPHVQAPTLLIVGGEDEFVIDLNQQAMQLLHGEKRLEIVPGATHLFEEPGTLEQVASLATHWFVEHLALPKT